MLLQLASRFSMVCTVLHKALVTSPCRAIEELLQRPRNFNTIIILEALVQLNQHLVESSLVLGHLVDHVLHLSPGNSRKRSQQVDRGLFVLLLQFHLFLVELDAFPPFLVVLGLVGEQGDVVVPHSVTNVA